MELKIDGLDISAIVEVIANFFIDLLKKLAPELADKIGA